MRGIEADYTYHCDDCEKYNLCEYYHNRRKTSQICPKFLLDTSKMWVSVSERLPENGQRVIATVDLDQYREGFEVRETIYGKHGFLCGNVTAWMPLPEPYKAERGDKK